MKIMMTRGSGCADPGVETVKFFFFYAARIRDCGSGRAETLLKIFHDDVQIRGYGSKNFSMMTRGSGSADPGVTYLFRGLYSQFISGSTPDA